MKSMLACSLLATALALSASVANAREPAAAGWSDSISYASPSEKSLQYSQAYQEYLARRGALMGVSKVTYNDHRVSNDHSTNTTECSVAGACQTGGTATNINGYTANNVGGTGNSVSTNISTNDTSQTAGATSSVVPKLDSDVVIIGNQNHGVVQ